MKFKVGDKIVGKNLRDYTITNKNAIMKVVKVYDTNNIKVEILEHKTNPDRIGWTYDVMPKYFDPYKTPIIEDWEAEFK